MAEAKNTKQLPPLLLDDSVKQNKRGEAILGRLYGPCADIIHATRNGRKYPEEVWERVFNNEIINEFFEAGGLLGELDHPEDRIETCTEKVAICMPEKPVKDKDGHLVASFDILDTPNGRIAYTLAKYGYKLGISSRGDGEVFEDYKGEEVVDANTFDLRGFDLVLLPAVKAARLQMVESMQKSFKQALTEALNKSDDAGRKIQMETLSHLGITEGKIEENESQNEVTPEPEEEIKPQSTAADDDGAKVIEQLQEALSQNNSLEQKVQELQEKLSVCYAKEVKLNEELDRYKNTVINLSNSAHAAKELKTHISALERELKESQEIVKKQNARMAVLKEKYQSGKTELQKLNESLDTKNSEILRLNEDAKSSNSKILSERDSLKESLNAVQQDLKIKSKEYTKKLSDANNLVEHYRKVASIAINRYIDSKASQLGVSNSDIKTKLGENYSFKDIDRICENLQRYKVSIERLPFRVNKEEKIKVKMTESVKPTKMLPNGLDDEIDESLLRLAGLADDE